MEQPLWALLGVIPPLIAMMYVDHVDRKRPEPVAILRRVALAGALAAIPILVIELLLEDVRAQLLTYLAGFSAAGKEWLTLVFRAFVIAGLTEETGKLICIAALVFRRPEFDERLDGVVYGARAGLGFALIENVAYLLQAQDSGEYVTTFIARALLAVPGHATWGALIGGFAARQRFDGLRGGLFFGWACAVILHGLYDLALFCAPNFVKHQRYGEALICTILAVTVIAGGVLAIRRFARGALAADDREALRRYDRARNL